MFEDEEKILFKEERYEIWGAAQEVHFTLGNGFLEQVYQDAFEKELQLRGIPYKREQYLQITYKGQVINHTYKADFLCYGKIVVEMKAVTKLNENHFAQALNYLAATGLEVALVANFGAKRFESKWIIKSRDRNNVHEIEKAVD